MSQDGGICKKRDINTPGDDYGSRAGSCRVCDCEHRAASRYEAVYAAAERDFNAVKNAAWSKELEEEEAAKYVIDAVRQVDMNTIFGLD